MPRARRTYWLYPDLDSPQARRNARTPIFDDAGVYDQARFVHQPGQPRSFNHQQLHMQYKVTKDQANLVSSNVDGKEGVHMPCLDLDIPHKYVPSSTEGHGHLYIDVEVPEDKYFALLDLLGECNILEPGYVRASKAKGGTYLRPEGVKKKYKRKAVKVETETAPTREAGVSVEASPEWQTVASSDEWNDYINGVMDEPVSEVTSMPLVFNHDAAFAAQQTEGVFP